MANEPVITIVGNATGDAELQFLPSGVAVANFTVAQTPRKKNGDQWEDGDTMFFRVTAWRDMAEHIAESVKRGMRVVVTGRLTIRPYETKEGEKRISVEVQADEVGLALRYATGYVQKAERQQASQQQQGGWGQQGSDPWATGATPPQPQQGGWGAPQQPQQGWGQPQQQGGPPPQQGGPPPQQQGGWVQQPAYEEPPF